MYIISGRTEWIDGWLQFGLIERRSMLRFSWSLCGRCHVRVLPGEARRLCLSFGRVVSFSLFFFALFTHIVAVYVE